MIGVHKGCYAPRVRGLGRSPLSYFAQDVPAETTLYLSTACKPTTLAAGFTIGFLEASSRTSRAQVTTLQPPVPRPRDRIPLDSTKAPIIPCYGDDGRLLHPWPPPLHYPMHGKRQCTPCRFLISMLFYYEQHITMKPHCQRGQNRQKRPKSAYSHKDHTLCNIKTFRKLKTT